MLMQQLTNYLELADIDYQSQSHPLAYTAQQIAELCKVNGVSFAKTVMVVVDGNLAMIVMPASCTIDFGNIAQAIDATRVDLAYEHQFRNAFPDCETGAMPPFGNLFNIPVYLCDVLSKQPMMSFNAGNHRELLQMKSADFVELVQPTVINSGFNSAGLGYSHEHTRQGIVRH
jgi:Ala-tRNA(Pro) deacylase